MFSVTYLIECRIFSGAQPKSTRFTFALQGFDDLILI